MHRRGAGDPGGGGREGRRVGRTGREGGGGREGNERERKGREDALNEPAIKNVEIEP